MFGCISAVLLDLVVLIGVVLLGLCCLFGLVFLLVGCLMFVGWGCFDAWLVVGSFVVCVCVWVLVVMRLLLVEFSTICWFVLWWLFEFVGLFCGLLLGWWVWVFMLGLDL